MTDAAAEWVHRVLGVRVGAPETSGPAATMLDRCERRWNAALQDAMRASQRFHVALQAEDPAAADGLDRIIESYWSELSQSLTRARKDAGKAGAMAPVVEAASRLRGEVGGDITFRRMAVSGAPVASVMVSALDDVEATLSAAPA